MRAQRALGVVVVSTVFAALLAAAAIPAGASASPVTKPAVVTGSRYLALGDSITFGYREATTVPAPNYRNASSFIGYPQLVGAVLRLKVANAACPGETSSSLINTSGPSNGCTNHAPPVTTPTQLYRTYYPLHVSYTGSQLSYAVKYLRNNRNVRLVSLEIGANDLFRCQSTTKDGCGSTAEQQAVLSTVRSNIRTILSAIRLKARYRGQIVIVNYYSLDYTSAFITGIVQALNQAQDSAGGPFGVLIANGYGQFYQGSLYSGANPCTAGLLTQLGKPSSCGVHPSYAGQSLLALSVEMAVHH